MFVVGFFAESFLLWYVSLVSARGVQRRCNATQQTIFPISITGLEKRVKKIAKKKNFVHLTLQISSFRPS